MAGPGTAIAVGSGEEPNHCRYGTWIIATAPAIPVITMSKKVLYDGLFIGLGIL
jgi:hypothetical protein